MSRDKINADGGEQDAERFTQGERFVKKNQTKDRAAYDEHAVDWDDHAGWSFR